MKPVFLTGFKTVLTGNMSSSATVLPISASDAENLCTRLDGSYSFLAFGSEVAKVECDEGVPVLTRGDNPESMAKGDCVVFEVTSDLLDDYIDSRNPPVCGIEGGTGISVEPKEEGSCEFVVKFDTDECPPVSWKTPEGTYKYENGCVTFEEGDGGCQLMSGTYENATVVVNEDGYICSIQSGSNIVYSQTSCCGNCGD